MSWACKEWPAGNEGVAGGSIIGTSAKIRTVLEAAQRAAKSDAGVLLLGESGTGKELLARSIHQWSPRHAMPLVVINCVALTETLLENELFGHERGAFTGADRLQKGKLEMAEGGTVFLDEIGDMSLPLQAKLLRVLQDREFHRVGGTKLVSVNIRIIAATNKDLKQAVKAGDFREDLFFRLNVIGLILPPLRERLEDFPALAKFFLNRHAKEAKRPGMWFSPAAMDALAQYSWPGNIRELRNLMERIAIMTDSEELTEAVLSSYLEEIPDGAGDGAFESNLRARLAGSEREVLCEELKRTGWNVSAAAKSLGIDRASLHRKMKRHGITRAAES